MKNKNDIMPNGKKRLIHNKYNKIWAKSHRNKYRKYLLDWRHKREEWYFNLKKGKSCEICGESHPACLDYHHKNPQDKINLPRRMAMSTANNNLILKEISKCMLICSNCHRKIHYKEKIK
jgi:hypothetical protein